MKVFWKYFFRLLILGILIVFYFLKTDLGNQNLRYFIENYLSKKTYNKIEVSKLNLEKYPHITMELQVNKTATVILKGKISNYNIDMYYHLIGDAFRFNTFFLEDTIDVEGKLTGSFSALNVRGYGKAFQGEINYNFINTPKIIKAMRIEMKKVSSQKVLKFLEEEPLVNGFADIDTEFRTFSKYKKQGQTKIYMDKAYISQISKDIPFVLNATMKFEGMGYKYEGDINSSIGIMTVKNAKYCRGRQIDNGEYTIDFKDISYFEKALKGKYKGGLNLQGSFVYDNHSERVIIKGKTSQFGGGISYIYKDNNIDFKLESVSLENLLRSFSYPVLFSSKIYGTIGFSIEENILLMDLALKKTRFKHSQLTDIIYDKLEMNLLDDVYDKSYFLAGYQNALLSSTLKIDNGKNHIYLTNTKMNILTNSIDSNFEMILEEQEVHGEIYGTLKNPQVWIDKNKFLKHETKRHVGSWLGTSK